MQKENKLTDTELEFIMYPGNILFDLVDFEWKYENKYHPMKRKRRA